MGILHAPTPGSVSPALLHGESQVPRNKKSESSRRSFETAPRQETVRQEANAFTQEHSAAASQTTRPIHPRISDTPTLPPSATLRKHVVSYCQKNRATQPRTNHPPPSAPRRVMHARGPLWSAYVGGRVDDAFSSNGMVRSHV